MMSPSRRTRSATRTTRFRSDRLQEPGTSPEVFEAIFCAGDVDAIDLGSSSLSSELVLRMRKEFEYDYPMDLRVSGKDLTSNHLTMALYNHATIWPKQSTTRWPQSDWTNGWAILDAEKRSKSTGNCKTNAQCVELNGADAIRFALANAGDTLEDGNFESTRPS